jgi:hypothetical protein
VGDEREVAAHQPALHGLVERAADDEVVWSQPPQRDPAEGGDDVVVDVAAVGVVGRVGEH